MINPSAAFKKLTVKNYIHALDETDALSAYGPKFQEVADLIDQMSHEERKFFRGLLAGAGEDRIMQNLVYDYTEQMWIE